VRGTTSSTRRGHWFRLFVYWQQCVRHSGIIGELDWGYKAATEIEIQRQTWAAAKYWRSTARQSVSNRLLQDVPRRRTQYYGWTDKHIRWSILDGYASSAKLSISWLETDGCCGNEGLHCPSHRDGSSSAQRRVQLLDLGPCNGDAVFFPNTMPRDRFWLLLKKFILADNSTFVGRAHPNYELVNKLGDIYQSITQKFESVYYPHQNLSIDEGTVPWKGNLRFKVYNPMKPKKYGMKHALRCSERILLQVSTLHRQDW